jgi:ribonuclease HII
MRQAHQNHPEYNWAQNMGYPTKAHREAIKQFGPTPLHRMTFTLLNDQLSLDI